jgi:hypothetical protein
MGMHFSLAAAGLSSYLRCAAGLAAPRRGAIAQLGERYNGIVEVTGSIPVGSTNYIKGLARRLAKPFLIAEAPRKSREAFRRGSLCNTTIPAGRGRLIGIAGQLMPGAIGSPDALIPSGSSNVPRTR